MEFNYLCVNIASSRNLVKQIKTQTQKESSRSICLFKLSCLEKQKYENGEKKSEIYNVTVCPIMTYALETRAKTLKIRQMLEANRMKVLRKIVGKTKIDRIRSQHMRETCGIQPN